VSLTVSGSSGDRALASSVTAMSLASANLEAARMRARALNNTSSLYHPPGTNRAYSYEPGNF
jgi:hypothetical protein